jgi:sialic acid synthase SpsE
MIILDLGGGGVHKNDKGCIKETIDSIVDINRRRDMIIKFQLHPQWGDKTAMRPDVFDWAYRYARDLKFDVTASAFDTSSKALLDTYETPFFKVANQAYLRRLFVENIDIEDVVSVPDSGMFNGWKLVASPLCCVSEYPASYEKYVRTFTTEQLNKGISDHTGHLDLYAEYEPDIYEAHYMLKKYDDKKREYVLGPKELEELENLRTEECI